MTLLRIGRIFALGLALTITPVLAAQADDVGGAEISVPAETTVIVEEVVTAPPPAFVDLSSTSIGAGLGISWGDGTLSYEGNQYSFTVTEIGLGELGFSKINAMGGVENLSSVSDFDGHYVAVGASATMGKGAGTVTMRNDKGVTITLQAETKGLQLSLAAKGITINVQ